MSFMQYFQPKLKLSKLSKQDLWMMILQGFVFEIFHKIYGLNEN